MSIPFIDMISIVVLLSIGAIYVLSVLNAEEGISVKYNFISKMSGIASALVLNGVLFSLLHWPNSIVSLSLGGISLIGVLFGGSVLKLFKTEHLPLNMMIRIVVLIILSGFFLVDAL